MEQTLRATIPNSSNHSGQYSADSPRKGRKWSLQPNAGSPEQPDATQQQPRGFRLLSPKKALELRKQAKAREEEEKKLSREEGDGGSGNMLPIWEKAPGTTGGGVPPQPKRMEINIKPGQLNIIEDHSEDGSTASVGVEELFGLDPRGNEAPSDLHWGAPARTSSGPQPARPKAPVTRRSISEQSEYHRSFHGGDSKHEMSRDSTSDRRFVSTKRHPPSRTRSYGCEDRTNPTAVPTTQAAGQSPNKQKGQYPKSGRPDDFHQSLHFTEVFENVPEEDVGRGSGCDPLSAQEEEMLAMALEQSVRDVGTISLSTRRPCQVPTRSGAEDVEKEMLRKQDWNEKYTYTPRTIKSNARPGRQNGPATADAVRIAEEEQEKEMIQLAMERSLADIPSRTSCASNVQYERARRQQRYGQTPGNRVSRATPPMRQTNDDELEKREQEMMRRALEMSRNDF